MSVLKLNYEELCNTAEKAKKAKIRYKPGLSSTFLPHILPILASVKLETKNGKISSKDTFSGLLDYEYIETPNGEISGINVQYLIRFLYLVNRGDLIYGSQINNSTLAAFTPLMLFAHKLYNNVPYSKWDKEDKAIKGFLGPILEVILEVKNAPELTIDKINTYRNMALTFKSGAKAGTIDKLTNYKCSISTLEDIPYPRTAIMMYLQTWLANAAIRDTNSMILDPINWDVVPEALDIVVKEEVPWTIEKSKSRDSDLPWNL